MNYRFVLVAMCLVTIAQSQVKQASSKSQIFQSAQKVSTITVPKQRNCYTVEYETTLLGKIRGRLSTESFEEKLSKQIESRAALRTASSTEEIYRIPTIVHVVHNGEEVGSGSNISQEQVNSQFDVLNEDYRRLGGGYNDDPVGADIRIEFYPVTLDPDGNALEEPGIDRVNGGQSSWSVSETDSDLKPITYWDPESYFNIWVVNLEDYLGYAQFPSLSGLDGLDDDEGLAETDGVVIGYSYFGNTGNVTSPYDLGRTATHEVGHWLGLRHIWGDGGCSVDDYCDDTPLAGEANYTCDANDSCTDDDEDDMIENYMDYTYDECMNIFTQDQKTRIRTVLEICPRRYTLITPSCDDAEEAIVGTNTGSAPTWFTYTAEENEIVTVSSVGQTDINTLLRFHSSCETSAINTSDDALGTEQSELSTLLEAGDSIKIYWGLVESEDEFSWTLTTTDSTDAMVCDLAVSALEGTNSLPSTDLNTYWYTYTPTEEYPKITIESDGHQFTVYTNDCDELEEAASGTSSAVITGIDSDQIFVVFEADGGDFSWTLTEEALSEGEACSVAATASTGTNSAPSAPYWYTYTMSDNGYLVLSGSASIETHVIVYDACGGEAIGENEDASSSDLSITLDAGDEVKILWDSTYSTESFEWSLSETEYQTGENCSAAEEAVEGENSASGAPYWYSYTMTSDGGLLITSEDLTNEDTYLYVYDDCDGDVLVESDDIDYSGGVYQSEGYISGLTTGETVYIYWDDSYSSAAFSWELSEVESQDGDDCSTAIAAQIGTNTVPETYASYFWTTYTVPSSDMKLAISSEADEYGIFADNCTDLNALSSGYQQTSITGLTEGEEILIVWTTDNGGDFEWELSVGELESGDLCSDPLEAIVGTNSASYAPIWYTYTMPKSGDLRITSEDLTDEDTYLYVYSECDGDVLDENDDISYSSGIYQSELLFEGVDAGEIFYIFWSNDYSSAAFDWSLALENIENSTPVIESQTFTFTELTSEEVTIGTVEASDDDGDALTYSIISGNSEGIFSIDESTGELTADLSLWPSNSYSQSIVVQVSDRVVTASASIEVTYYVLGVDNSEIIIYPNPTNGVLFIESSEALQRAEVIDLSGKRVLQTTSEQIDLTPFGSGIYFVRLFFNQETKVYRISLEK